MVDADAITIMRFLLDVCGKQERKPNFVIELVQTSNVKFVGFLGKEKSSSTNHAIEQVASPCESVFESKYLMDSSYASGIYLLLYIIIVILIHTYTWIM